MLVTKSGRKVTRPKMQHFITEKKLVKIIDCQSEMEEEDQVTML